MSGPKDPAANNVTNRENKTQWEGLEVWSGNQWVWVRKEYTEREKKRNSEWISLWRSMRDIENNSCQKRNPFVYFPPGILSLPASALCFLSPCIFSLSLSITAAFKRHSSVPGCFQTLAVHESLFYFNAISALWPPVSSSAVITSVENAVMFDCFACKWGLATELQIQLLASLLQYLLCSQCRWPQLTLDKMY